MDTREMFQFILSAVQRSRATSAEGLIRYARAALLRAGVNPAPVGAGNAKTGLPSTYRKVGDTCPVACRFHPVHWGGERGASPCYAEHGKVALIQRRSEEGDPLAAVAVAMIVRQETLARGWDVGNPRQGCRLHTSGDFMREGEVDLPYIAGVMALARLTRRAYGVPNSAVVAYTYTHIPEDMFAPYAEMLERSGVSVMWSLDSGEPRPGVAVVRSHQEDLGGAVPCPAQVRDDWSCARCGLCSFAKSRVNGVAFDPHGARRAAV